MTVLRGFISERGKRGLKGGLISILVYVGLLLWGTYVDSHNWLVPLLVRGPGSVLNLYGSFRDAEHMTIALIPVQIHAINLIYYFLAGAIPSFLFKKSWICILLWIIAAIVAIIIAWLSIVLLGFSTPTRGI